MTTPYSAFGNQPFLLQAAIESSNNGVTIADAQKADLPLIYVNKAFAEITGYSPSEVLGKNCRFLHAQERDQEGLDAVRKSLAEGTSCHVVIRNYRKDGATFWNELYMSPVLDASGNITHFVGIQNDVTRRVEAERKERELSIELRQKNEKLQALNNVKNEFLGIAAHDLRNPLSTVMLSSSILVGNTIGALTDKQNEVVELIRNSAEYMLRLVNDLLDVSSIEAGKISLSMNRVDLIRFLRAIVALHRHRSDEKGITLELHAPNDKELLVDLDEHRFRQVADNLISNAIKFSENGARIDVTVATHGESAVISVSDTGPGIPAEELDQLFQPFARTSVKPSDGEKSTGLGLVICRKVIESHGGHIEVESEVGRGSTFAVHLPLPVD